MKLIPTALACLIAFVLTSPARADDESDRAGLRLILTNYMDAVNSAAPAKIAPFLSKEVTGVMVTGEEVKGFEGLEAYWKKIQDLIGPGGNYHVIVNVDKTDLFGDIAVSRGSTEDAVHLATGKELRFNSRWTSVCHKEDGAWKVVRMQAAMDPVDNVFISLKLQKTRFSAGATGLLAGVIVTAAVGILRKRRPATAGA